MLHGLGATGGLNWAGSQHFLADRFRVVTIDHRGHGRGIRTRDFRLEDCADDAAACIDALGLEHPILVGYSMGGPVAALLWQRHPGLARGLVFCATSRNFKGSPGEKLTFAAMGLAGSAPVFLPTRLVRLGGALMGAIPIPQPGPVRDARWVIDEIAGHDPRSIMQAAAAIGRFNSADWIDQIDVPTAVVAMTQDQIVPAARQLRLARSLPGARVHCVDAGHLCLRGGPAKVRFLTALRQACLDVAPTT
jgi:pimeloyl-ACP methyl ester carboxylesterase